MASWRGDLLLRETLAGLAVVALQESETRDLDVEPDSAEEGLKGSVDALCGADVAPAGAGMPRDCRAVRLRLNDESRRMTAAAPNIVDDQRITVRIAVHGKDRGRLIAHGSP